MEPTLHEAAHDLLKAKMKTILLVEDEYLLSMVFQMMLERHGYQVHVASHGCEALEYLENKVPDLILTDNMMPVMDGIQFLQKIKLNPMWQYIPVVLMSAAHPPSLNEGKLWDVFVSKLASTDVLVAAIQQLLDV
jgi:CheY-like chemotaxis protein